MVKPTDIAHLITLGSPTLSPDGRTAVVAATRPDLDENEYRGQLWTVPTDGSAPPRRLTHGTARLGSAVLPGWTLAGVPARRERRQAAAARAAGRWRRGTAAHRPGTAAPVRRLVARLRIDRVHSAGPRARPVRPGRGRHPGKGTAAPHHRTPVPTGRHRVPHRPPRARLRHRPRRRGRAAGAAAADRRRLRRLRRRVEP